MINDNIVQDFCKLSLFNTADLYKNIHPSIAHCSSLTDDVDSKRIKLFSKISDEYYHVKDTLPPKETPITINQQQQQQDSELKEKQLDNIISNIQDEKRRKVTDVNGNNMSIVVSNQNGKQQQQRINMTDQQKALVNIGSTGPSLTYTKPMWHPPWKLMRVVAGHTGWVRCISVDTNNEFFCTGATDNTIKFWDMASGELKVTLVYHVGAVRAIQLSNRHPYLFSVGEDNKIICWDLEANRPIRHYHGHVKGVFSLALHPTLDILFTGGKDSTIRTWDMRTKAEIFTLTGHKGTVCSLLSQSPDPQLISGGIDKTIRLWDLKAGRSAVTLTNHKKSVRSLVMHEKEFSFASASADNIKQWKLPEGQFIKNLSGHNSIVNCMALNQDNVLVSGGDNGSMQFWDWKTGYCFQKSQTIVQPGSLDSEAGVFAMAFDRTGTRLITCEADKTIKVYKEDEEANEQTHPITNEWRPNAQNVKRF